MKKKRQSKGRSGASQSVPSSLQFTVAGKAITVEFSDQKLSAHAGAATLWAWVHRVGFVSRLAAALPHAPLRSNNQLPHLCRALSFIHGIVVRARKLTHVAYLRRDELLPEILGVKRVASQSSLSRFFAGFDSAGANLHAFRGLWQWCLRGLPSRKAGYTLDLDSTRLVHEEGHQEGVKVGYTHRGMKPCLHPLLAVVAEARLVAQMWLRSGNASDGSNAMAFLQDLLAHWPRHLRLRAVRADAGFFLPDLLGWWEQINLPYVVVAQLIEPIKNLLRREAIWMRTELAGTDVCEVEYRPHRWTRSRRFILIRHRKAERPEAGGKKLIDLPGYTFQALVTSFGPEHSPLQVWRFYNGRADCENVIKELQSDFALPSLCLKKFWATEAALCLATLTYNLTVLFQRHLGWMKKVTAASLRYWLFITPGILVKPQRQTTIRIAIPAREQPWWQRLWEKILSPFPNCNSVENRPVFSS